MTSDSVSLRRLARAIPDDPMGQRLAQVADDLDAEIDRQARIITSSEGGVPASDVPMVSPHVEDMVHEGMLNAISRQISLLPPIDKGLSSATPIATFHKY
jgi:hypothetical protein